MAWLSRVNFTASDVLSYTDLNNLGNDIRAWGGNVNGGGYTLSNVILSASSGTMATVIGGTGTTSTLTLRSTSGVGTTGADIIFQAGNNGATEVMRLQNGGNVGIGTPSPAGKLDIVTGVYRGYFDDAAGSLFRLSAVNAANSAYGPLSVNGSVVTFQISASEKMRIDSSGNVGIGTSSPSQKLHVVGSILATPSTWGSSGSSSLFLGDTNNYIKTTFGGTTDIASYNSMTFITGPTPAERMRILSTGEVGIGTSSPSNKLTVLTTGALNTVGDAIDVGATFTGADYAFGAGLNPAILNVHSNSTLGAGVGATIGLGGRYTGTSFAQFAIIKGAKENATDGNYATFLAFGTRANGGSITERMRIDSSGNVLIGYTTSNGSYLLQVNSQIFATNATIATSDGRYKDNISPIKSGLDVVGKLNPVSFTWKQHEIHNFDSGTQVGFIAQDVQEALADEPYLESIVKRNEVELKDGTKEEFYGLSDAKLIPILVKAIQELKAEIDILKSRN